MPKVVIIGSGIAGICSAIRLAHAGFEVDVFEANDGPGGKLSKLELGDYKFDVGPSVFTMPQYIKELFDLCGSSFEDHFEFVKMEESGRYFWEDGTRLTFWFDKKKLASSISEALDIDPKPTLKHLESSSIMYDRIGKIFLEKSLHKAKTWLSKDVLKALMHLPSYKLGKTMNEVNAKELNHPKLVQIFNRFATYNGSNPFEAPGILNIIPHFDQNVGTFFPKKGMYSITTSLTELAKEQGVKFHFNTKVKEILVDQNKAQGIKTEQAQINADVVISNSDVYYTYTRLLPEIAPPKKRLNQPRSTSAIIYYWGIGSKVAKNEAPIGCESWFVMVNAPANTGQDWDKILKRSRTKILEKLSKILNVDLEQHIVEEDILEPRILDSRLNAYQGSIYGTSSNNKMAAFMRQPNFHKDIKGLYSCGGSVHPGGGVPISMLSAKITANMIIQDALK